MHLDDGTLYCGEKKKRLESSVNVAVNSILPITFEKQLASLGVVVKEDEMGEWPKYVWYDIYIGS